MLLKCDRVKCGSDAWEEHYPGKCWGCVALRNIQDEARGGGDGGHVGGEEGHVGDKRRRCGIDGSLPVSRD